MQETGERGSQPGNQSGNQREKAAIGVGETLPLFELPQMKKRTRQQSSHQLVASGRAPFSGHSVSGHSVGGRSVKPGGKRSGTVRNPRAVNNGDRHMHDAWQLCKALKAVKTVRKTGREMAKMTANQRHQVSPCPGESGQAFDPRVSAARCDPAALLQTVQGHRG